MKYSNVRGIGIGIFAVLCIGIVVYAVVTVRPRVLTREQVIEKVVIFNPKKAMTDEELGKQRELFEKVVDELRSAREKASGIAQGDLLLYWPLVTLGSIHRDVGDLKAAEMAFLEAQKIEPNAFIPYGSLGDLYLNFMNECAKAAPYYQKAATFKDGYLGTYYAALRRIYVECLKDIPEGERVLVEGVQTYPDSMDVLAELAQFYRDTQQFEKAKEQYQLWLEKDPTSAFAKQILETLK